MSPQCSAASHCILEGPLLHNPESDILEEHLFKPIKESTLSKYVISFAGVVLKTDKAEGLRYRTEDL